MIFNYFFYINQKPLCFTFNSQIGISRRANDKTNYIKIVSYKRSNRAYFDKYCLTLNCIYARDDQI